VVTLRIPGAEKAKPREIAVSQAGGDRRQIRAGGAPEDRSPATADRPRPPQNVSGPQRSPRQARTYGRHADDEEAERVPRMFLDVLGSQPVGEERDDLAAPSPCRPATW
jgi:hypothetical protein